MKGIILTALIGVAAGTLDILPMIKMKLDKFSVSSAFIFYFILPFIILNIELFGLVWWLKSGVIALALAIPIIVIAAKNDKKSVIPMIVSSVTLGTLIGIAGHFML